MLSRLAHFDEARLHRLQQFVKWVVYTLLIINWLFYIAEDSNRAMHTLEPGDSIVKWLREFSTSIDTSAWFILLFMYELETYILEDKSWTGWVAKTVHGLRIVCFLMIAHTVVAYVASANELAPTVLVDGASGPCDVADQDISWVYNLEYTDITSANCASISGPTELYKVGDDPVVSSFDGLELERNLAAVDVIEVITWLLIILAIEIVVRLQERNVTSGSLITLAGRSKILFYLVLFGLSAYWGLLGHWLYVWDTFLWIAGFAAIEMNIQEWRDEIREETGAKPQPAPAQGT
ncbi:MAG: hypothetical protein QNI98_08330 [Woeseiaceae bacterium]|nr:hypothetical protein [Woeseiaceae bacterium]